MLNLFIFNKKSNFLLVRSVNKFLRIWFKIQVKGYFSICNPSNVCKIYNTRVFMNMKILNILWDYSNFNWCLYFVYDQNSWSGFESFLYMTNLNKISLIFLTMLSDWITFIDLNFTLDLKMILSIISECLF